MAKFNPAFTPPVSTALTELWYSETETGAPTQIFGVQEIPRLNEPAEDITYRTLESDEEFATPGIKPYSSIEVPILLYKEQAAALEALDGETLWWYVKYPESYGIIKKWKGRLKYSDDGFPLDDMCKAVLKIYKDSTPTKVTAMPTSLV